MKVLFIGHYREHSGWGRAAQEYILALDEVCDVVCRPVKLNPVQTTVPERILELENKSDKDCDICIQCVLPHLLHYDSNFRNICIPFIDTLNLYYHPWLDHMYGFEIWSPCRTMHEELLTAQTEGRKIDPTAVIPVPCDPRKYENRKKIDIGVDLTNKFVFYSIFDLTPRKNILDLLRAFHLEFKPWEDVELIIKTGKYGKHTEEVRKQVIDMNEKVCQSLKLYDGKYKKPIIITEELSDGEIDGLHNLGDCFVLPSHGEAWCFPAFDAMAYGKLPIVTKGIACDDFIKYGHGVNSYTTYVSGMTDTFKQLFTGKEMWKQPELDDLMNEMRKVKNANKSNCSVVIEDSLEKAREFSRKKVGEKMLEILK